MRYILARPDRGQAGGIVTGWLLQIVLILAVIGVVVYELLAVVVSTATLDDASREVARAARDEYRVSRSIARATESAERTAELRDATVTAVTQDDDMLVVDLEREAPTLLIHRFGPLEELATTRTTSRTDWTS